jgi:hypothetical protein
VPGAKVRAYLLSFAVVAGIVVGVATLPAQHRWLHLSHRHDHRDGAAASIGRASP